LNSRKETEQIRNRLSSAIQTKGVEENNESTDICTGMVELVTLQQLAGGDGALHCLDLELDGGAGDLFCFWNSRDPLPTIPEPSVFLQSGIGVIGMLAYI
jgi:hypothetical protein